MLAVKQIKSDGTEIDLGRKKVDFRQLQELVASGTDHKLFEFVAMQKTTDGKEISSKYEVGGQVMAVNESGLIYGLPQNHAAMDLLGYWRDVSPTPIVGDVVIIENEEEDFG